MSRLLEKRRSFDFYKISKVDKTLFYSELELNSEKKSIEGTDEISSISYVDYFSGHEFIEHYDDIVPIKIRRQYKKIPHKKLREEAIKRFDEEFGDQSNYSKSFVSEEIDCIEEQVTREYVINAPVYHEYYEFILNFTQGILLASHICPKNYINTFIKEFSIKIAPIQLFPSFDELDVNPERVYQDFLNWLVRKAIHQEGVKLGSSLKSQKGNMKVTTSGRNPLDWHKDNIVRQIDITLKSKVSLTLKSNRYTLFNSFHDDQRRYDKDHLGLMRSVKDMCMYIEEYKRLIERYLAGLNPEELVLNDSN